MKKRNTSNLRLETQTIRTLSGSALAHAAGGSVSVSLGLSCSGPTTRGSQDSTTTQPVSIVSISVVISH